jgi:hypothetical protein
VLPQAAPDVGTTPACTVNTFSAAGDTSCTACPSNSVSGAAAATCACNGGYGSTGTGSTLACTGAWTWTLRCGRVVFLIANRDGRVLHLGCTAGTFSASGATCEGMSHLTPHTRTYVLWPTELLRFFTRLHSLQRHHLQRCLGDELHCLPGQQCQRRRRGHVHV